MDWINGLNKSDVRRAGGTQRLTRLLGPTKAKELIFSSRTMTAAQAEKIGV